jgi:hypothetical protein
MPDNPAGQPAPASAPNPPPAPAPPAEPGAAPPSTDPSGTAPTGQQSAPGSPNPSPEVAAMRAEIADLRSRAEKAPQDVVDKIAKALGITNGETPTVEQVTEQLTTAQRDARERAVDLAVYRAAPTASADPDALLDSATFRRRVADLDPTAAAFADQVAAAIADAVKTNPRLAAAPAAASRSGGEITGGSPTGDDLGALSIEDYIKRTRTRKGAS